MISERDIYADKNGKITDDPSEFAFQIAVKGCNLDERVARRYGIADTLISTGEPNAVRRVTGRSAASVRISKAADTETKPIETKAESPKPKAEDQPQEQPQEPAEAAEPTTVDEAKPEAEKPTAKEGEKKK